MNLILVIVLLVIAIICSIYFIYYYRSRDNFQNIAKCDKINILSHEEVTAFLRDDKDHYVQSMSSADLHARKAKTALEYINRISQCNKNETLLDPNDISLISKCALKADKFLEKYVYKSVIYGRDIAAIPWKFAIVCDDYEDGFPHTRQDIIFLTRKSIKTNEDTLTSLLIHEKTHIFQRYNPQFMDWFLASAGYAVVTYANDPKYKGLVRSNPDINHKVYIYNGRELVYLYKSAFPSGINDILNLNSMEHPYEQMAYDIGNDYLKERMKAIINIM